MSTETKPKETQTNNEESKEKERFYKIAAGAAIAVILLLFCGAQAKNAYTDAQNTLDYTIDPKKPVRIQESKADEFKASDLVRKKEGQKVKISGNLDAKNYKIQTIKLKYSMGNSHKEDTLKVKIIKRMKEPVITIKEELVNVSIADPNFHLKDNIETIVDEKGNEIPYLNQKVYKKRPIENENVAYFMQVGESAFNINKRGKYPIKICVYDAEGNYSEELFLVNVTDKKEEADRKLQTDQQEVPVQPSTPASENTQSVSGTSAGQSSSIVYQDEDDTVTETLIPITSSSSSVSSAAQEPEE